MDATHFGQEYIDLRREVALAVLVLRQRRPVMSVDAAIAKKIREPDL